MVGGCSRRSMDWYWKRRGQSVKVPTLDGEIDEGSGASVTHGS
jgi:hypothetical protein